MVIFKNSNTDMYGYFKMKILKDVLFYVCMYVYVLCVHCPWKLEEGVGSELQMVMSCHVGAGN